MCWLLKEPNHLENCSIHENMSRTSPILMSYRTPSVSDLLDSFLSSDLRPSDIWSEVANGTAKILNYRKNVKDDSVSYEIEVPGVEPSDVSVKVDGKILKVKTPKGCANFALNERTDVSKTEATLKYGVLIVNVPFSTSDVVEVNVKVD